MLFAAPEVCSDPQEERAATLTLAATASASLAETAGEVSWQERAVALAWGRPGPGWSGGFRHRYSVFDFEGVEPQTNGHVHTSNVEFHWRGSGAAAIRLSAAPGIAASSNIVKAPGRYDGKTFTLPVALLAGRQLDDRLRLAWGICGDQSFGEYRLYPKLSLLWTPPGGWYAELGFPASAIGYAAAANWSTELRLAPDGNEWRVEDRRGDARSRFVQESLALRWSVDRALTPAVTVSATAGLQFRSRYELRLADGGRLDTESDSSWRAAVSLRWRW